MKNIKCTCMLFRIILSFMIVMMGGEAWGVEVTYTVSSSTSVTTSGTAPIGATATLSGSGGFYSGAKQITNGNSAILTLSGFTGYKITGIKLSVKSNTSTGAGSFTAKVGTTVIASIADSKFNTTNWNGAWSTSAVDKTVTMSNNCYAISDNENVFLTITASENSLYIYSWTITYESVSNESCDIKWYVNGVEYTQGNPTLTTKSGTQLTTLPTEPNANMSDFKFVGWTNEEIVSSKQEIPSVIFTSVDESPLISSSTNFYAVFARVTTGGTPAWNKIEDAKEITDGTYALIRYDEKMYLPNSAATSDNPKESSVTKSNSTIDVKDDMKWNLTISMGVINLESFSVSGIYLFGGSANDAIRVNDKSGKDSATKDWYAEELSDYGIVLYNNAGNSKHYLAAYSDQDWRNYIYSSLSNTNRPANLYKLVDGVTYSDYCTTLPNTLTITLNAACHDAEGRVYGTYSSSKAFVVPEELTVAEVGVNSDGTIDVKSYKTGDVVAGGTGVMISADKGGSYVVEESASNSSVATVLGNANCLKPSGDNGITSTEMSTAASNCTYYRLTMHNGTQIGYWWGAEGGGAFDLAANKAYLAVPKSQSVKVNLWLSDIVTSIDVPNQKKANDMIYNLVGQKVNDAVKGIYIKNGKKCMMK